MAKKERPELRLIEAEIDFDVDLNGHSLAIFLGRFKLPLAHSFDSLFIQAHPELALNTDFVWPAIRADDDP